MCTFSIWCLLFLSYQLYLNCQPEILDLKRTSESDKIYTALAGPSAAVPGVWHQAQYFEWGWDCKSLLQVCAFELQGLAWGGCYWLCIMLLFQTTYTPAVKDWFLSKLYACYCKKSFNIQNHYALCFLYLGTEWYSSSGLTSTTTLQQRWFRVKSPCCYRMHKNLKGWESSIMAFSSALYYLFFFKSPFCKVCSMQSIQICALDLKFIAQA